MTTGKGFLAEVGDEKFRAHVLRWFPLAQKGRVRPVLNAGGEPAENRQRMQRTNATILRGLKSDLAERLLSQM